MTHEKCDVSQVGFRGCNASGGHIVLPPHLLVALCFQNGQFGRISCTLFYSVKNLGRLPPGACRISVLPLGGLLHAINFVLPLLHPLIPLLFTLTFGASEITETQDKASMSEKTS